MKRLAVLIAALGLCAASPLSAAVEPHAGAGDPRLRVVTYDPGEVVAVHGVLGYQMVIEFDPAEKIENVAIGDSVGWQVIPSRKANLLFLKPMEKAPPTNMAVVTNLRRYNFELSVDPRPKGAVKDIVYSLRFDYPAPAVAVVEAPPPEVHHLPQDLNHAYSYEGSVRIVPTRLFDDGQMTYFQFAPGEEYPAILATDPDKGETVVNSSMRDGYIVVDRLAHGFVLRRGKDVTRIYNDGFHEAQPGPLSPRPRRKSGWLKR